MNTTALGYRAGTRHGRRLLIHTVTGWRISLPAGEADSAGLTAACIAIATAAYYAAARAAEQSRRPWLAAIGRFLLGGIARTPVYPPNQPSPDRDYD